MVDPMHISQRTMLWGVAVLPMAINGFGFAVVEAASGANEISPILFVHGYGNHAQLWMTTML